MQAVFGIIGGRGITTVRYELCHGEWIVISATRRGASIPWNHSPGWILERCIDVDCIIGSDEYTIRSGIVIGGMRADTWQSGHHMVSPEELLVTV